MAARQKCIYPGKDEKKIIVFRSDFSRDLIVVIIMFGTEGEFSQAFETTSGVLGSNSEF